MEKPISMKITETKEQLAKVCNESKLPICVLDMVVKEVYSEVHKAAGITAKEEAAKYIQATLEEQRKEGEENHDN